MAGSYEDYKTYINDLYKTVLKKTKTVDYTERSPGQLKSMLEGYLKPGLTKSIQQRQESALANNAATDADAAARGMGGSTWLTDMKNRQNNALATDVAGLQNDYNSNLYSSLLSKISEQEQNKLTVDQYNATQRNKALDRAFAAANANASSWSKAGSGGGPGKTPDPNTDPNFGKSGVTLNWGTTPTKSTQIKDNWYTPKDKSKTAAAVTRKLNQVK